MNNNKGHQFLNPMREANPRPGRASDYGVDKKTGKPQAKDLKSSDLKAMAIPTHTKSGFTAVATRNYPKPLPGVWLNDYVWTDKKIAVAAAQVWIDGFGDGKDYWKNADLGTKALAKFAKKNAKKWNARVKGENLQQDAVDFLDGVTISESTISESTDFKGSKSVSITRFSGGDKGMMIQLTDKKRGNIQMPVQEASILGRALQDKKLMKA